MNEIRLKQQILKQVADYYKKVHLPKIFIPGVSPVPASGKVFDEWDMRLLVD